VFIFQFPFHQNLGSSLNEKTRKTLVSTVDLSAGVRLRVVCNLRDVYVWQSAGILFSHASDRCSTSNNTLQQLIEKTHSGLLKMVITLIACSAVKIPRMLEKETHAIAV
jgi:hypothetical protein